MIPDNKPKRVALDIPCIGSGNVNEGRATAMLLIAKIDEVKIKTYVVRCKQQVVSHFILLQTT
jgi:hypothetical protein